MLTNTRFYFGSFFNNKVYLFGSNLRPACVFENGVFNEIAVDSVVDAQVYDEKLFFIDVNYSGIKYLDSQGEVHTEEIACDSLMRFSVVNGQLFVSGKCNEFLLSNTPKNLPTLAAIGISTDYLIPLVLFIVLVVLLLILITIARLSHFRKMTK
jgi:hypothetical protein